MIEIYPKLLDVVLAQNSEGVPILTTKELRCQCTQNKCKHTTVSTIWVEKFKRLRELVSVKLNKNTPIHIASGFRCNTHNIVVGGADLSQHKIGLGVDLITPIGLEIIEFGDLALQAGFTFVIVYSKKNIIHTDVRGLD